MQNLFVYGSLMFPDLMKALCGRDFEMLDANLYGFRRLMVCDQPYPAIIPEHGQLVRGKLILNVPDDVLGLLVFYEGDEYRQETVEVQTGHGTIVSEVFVWNVGITRLLDATWEAKVFERDFLEEYVRRIAPETIREYQQTKGETGTY